MRVKAAVFAVTVVLGVVLVACGRAPTLPPDDTATYQLLTGGNGQEFLRQISSHDWDDGGQAAAERLSWIARDAESTDESTAKRAGEAAHEIAVFIAGNKDELSRLSSGWFGFQHRSVGELNPELVRGYASALSPFQGALVGDVKSVSGFTIIGDGADVSSARNVFAVIDTNTQAGKDFNDSAYQRVKDYLHTYAEAVAGGKREGLVALQHAAELAGVVDGGQRESGNEAIKTETAQHWMNWAGYEVASAMGVRPDGPEIPNQFFAPDGHLTSPDQVSVNDLPIFANALKIFTSNHGLPGLGSDIRRWYDAAAGK
jgi:hypothetical protein